MPNSNTNPQAIQGAAPFISSHETMHAYARLRHLQDCMDYALREYQTALHRAEQLHGSAAQLWEDAADAFSEAYDAMQRLASLPDADSFPQAKELLHQANHMADEAAAASSD